MFKKSKNFNKMVEIKIIKDDANFEIEVLDFNDKKLQEKIKEALFYQEEIIERKRINESNLK